MSIAEKLSSLFMLQFICKLPYLYSFRLTESRMGMGLILQGSKWIKFIDMVRTHRDRGEGAEASSTYVGVRFRVCNTNDAPPDNKPKMIDMEKDKEKQQLPRPCRPMPPCSFRVSQVNKI